MNKMKYVMLDFRTPIIFPRDMYHADVARAFAPRKVTSAGFCNAVNWGGVVCHGESAGLGIGVNELDAQIIQNHIAPLK